MATLTLELSLPVVLSMFSDLVGKKVSGTEIEPTPIDVAETERTVRAVFVNEAGPGAIYLVDLELAAAWAASLVMMPAGLVKECLSEKTLLPGLSDNTFEVVNVASRLVNRAGGTHYRLREQVLPGQPLPEDAAGLLEEHTMRTDLQLTVEGYGSGKLTILVA